MASEVVITKCQNPEHRDSLTFRLSCTLSRQKKSVHVTELGNGEGLKDILLLGQMKPRHVSFLVICQPPVTETNGAKI
jgi:hypothetical protein